MIHHNLEELTKVKPPLSLTSLYSSSPYGQKAEKYPLKLRYSSVLEPAQPSHKRIFYATPYGELHFKMPSIEYILNEEKTKWCWFEIKIKPSYEE